MKSYIEHIQSIKKNLINNQGIFRSSAIFPFLINDDLDTQISFLSYWFIKRKIRNIKFRLSLRDAHGKKIYYFKDIITYTKVFNYSVKNILKKINYKINKSNIIGSIELEFFSDVNMVFPFPAVIINMKHFNSSTFVHTCGRIYNDNRDKKENTKYLVPETGFDILPEKGLKPFFAFVNGKNKIKNTEIKIEIINDDGKKIIKKILIDILKPYQTKFNFFLNESEKDFLKNKKGIAKIYHNFKDFYPRFMAGNFEENLEYTTLTHTYYDLSNQKNFKNNIWKNPSKTKYFDSSVGVPIYMNGKSTELVIYPNIFKKKFLLKIGLFKNDKFSILYKKTIKNLERPLYLNLTEKSKKLFKLNRNKVELGKIICSNSGIIPSRIKFGLNIYSEKKVNIPSNICFNAFLPTKNAENKPGTFRWGFVNPDKEFEIVIINNSFLKKNNKDANIKIKFWNNKKNIFLQKNLKIRNHGLKVLKPNKNIFNKYKQKNNYWFTIESDNPFLSGYFINFNKSGLVGAEHFF